MLPGCIVYPCICLFFGFVFTSHLLNVRQLLPLIQSFSVKFRKGLLHFILFYTGTDRKRLLNRFYIPHYTSVALLMWACPSNSTVAKEKMAALVREAASVFSCWIQYLRHCTAAYWQPTYSRWADPSIMCVHACQSTVCMHVLPSFPVAVSPPTKNPAPLLLYTAF